MHVDLLFLILSLSLLTACGGNSDSWNHQPITISILHTNDTHSRLEPFPRDSELSANNPGPQQGGIARRKTIIDEIRAIKPHTLLLDSGDNFQGTIFYNAWKGSAEVMALNALGYDATTLGNHEFDMEPAELGRALRGEPVAISSAVYETEPLRTPMIATNVDTSRESALSDLLPTSVILERGGEQFGILGIVTEDVPTVSKPGSNLSFLDYVASVQAEANRLTEQGVNKIILLSHYGYTVDVQKALQLRGVDLIISGHDHALLGDPTTIDAVAPGQGALSKGPYPTVVTAQDGNPVLIVSANESGRWLGQIDVSFDKFGVIQNWQSQPVFVRGCEFANGAVECQQQVAAENAVIKAKVAAYRQPVEIFANTIIGQAGMFFDAQRAPGVRTQEMPQGNLIADVFLESAANSDQVDAAIINGGGIRADLNQGDITFEDALAVLPFGNTLVAMEIDGDTLIAALDYGVSQAGDGAFPQIAGMTLTYCTQLPCVGALRTAGRVTKLTINHQPVDPSTTYRIAINGFMAGGGDGYTMLQELCASGAYCRDTGILGIDLLVEEFTTNSPVIRSIEGRIIAK